MSRQDTIREAIEESEAFGDTPPPAGNRGVRKNRETSSVYSVRLPNAVIDELNALAIRLEVPVSALVRGFILDGLADSRGGDLISALDRLERDVLEVRRRAISA